MNKLKLELDTITVETFSTGPAFADRGTVKGQGLWSIDGGAYCSWQCGGSAGPPCNTAKVTCEYGPTMNPMDTNCLDATMAGATCEGPNTCYETCPY